jgi:uncharacterized protein with LGFP repeats
MNVTHQQQKASLGNPISNITKILEDNYTDNTNDIGSHKISIDVTVQNSSNDSDAKYYQNFTEGAVYWKRDTGAREVHGAIYSKWKELGLERSDFGYPITNIEPTPQKGEQQ